MSDCSRALDILHIKNSNEEKFGYFSFLKESSLPN